MKIIEIIKQGKNIEVFIKYKIKIKNEIGYNLNLLFEIINKNKDGSKTDIKLSS